MTQDRSSPEDLLANATWLHRLARKLVADPHLAADLAQDTCVVAMSKMDSGVVNQRGWMARVLRNFAVQSHRNDARRRTWEGLASPGAHQPATDELVERLSTHREVVDAVLKLDEPYRVVLTLRFFEDLRPKEIGKRLGVPVKTVYTRIDRALAHLRRSLDRRFGNQQSWVLALLPLAQPLLGSTATLLGITFMKAKIAIAAVLLGGAAIWWATSDTTLPQADTAPEANQTAPEPQRADGDPLRTADDPQRVAITPGETQSAEPPTATDTAALVRGRVLDTTARPVAGAPIQLTVRAAESRTDSATDTSDDGGWFQVSRPDRGARAWVDSPEYATLFPGVLTSDATEVNPIVVVAPALQLRGQVHDQDGSALDRVRIQVQLPENFRSRFPVVLDYSSDHDWDCVSNETGEFEFGNVGFVPGASLLAIRDGYEPTTLELPRTSTDSLRVVLNRPVVAEGAVQGVVLDPAGAPVAEARVAMGLETTVTDGFGAFTFDKVAVEADGGRIMALKSGFLPAVKDAPAADAEWTPFVTLQLGPAPLTISGTLFDSAGDPLDNGKIWLKDPTFFGLVDRGPVAAEALLAGAPTRSEAQAMIAALPAGVDPREYFGDRAMAGWAFVDTDAAGRFLLEGLMDREYTVVAMDRGTLLRIESAPVVGGTQGMVLRLPPDSLYPRVTGKVVDRHGNPMAGVEIGPMIDAFVMRVADRGQSTSHDNLEGTTTGPDGSFAFSNLPRIGCYLRIDGNTNLPLEFGRGLTGGFAEAGNGLVEALEIVVRRRVHVQVEIAGGTDAAESLQVLNDQGEALMINVFQGTSRRTTRRLPIQGETTPAFVVPDDAATMVFFRGETQIREIPLILQIEGLNKVVY